MTTDSNKVWPLHPGEVLREEFMAQNGLTSEQLARELQVSSDIVADLVEGRRGLTLELAQSLAERFRTSLEFWTNMQKRYEADIESDLGTTADPLSLRSSG